MALKIQIGAVHGDERASEGGDGGEHRRMIRPGAIVVAIGQPAMVAEGSKWRGRRNSARAQIAPHRIMGHQWPGFIPAAGARKNSPPPANPANAANLLGRGNSINGLRGSMFSRPSAKVSRFS